jgi:hypothetical protein
VAGDGDVLLGQTEGVARRHRELQRHQVETGDELGDAVLDLEAGVHLQEEELVAVHQELHRSHALIAHRLGRGDGRAPHGGAGGLAHQDGRGLLNHLLVSPLHRALAIEEMQHAPGDVADHLDLHVTRRGQVALEEDLR